MQSLFDLCEVESKLTLSPRLSESQILNAADAESIRRRLMVDASLVAT